MSQTLQQAPRSDIDAAGSSSTIRLFEVDPDLGRFLTPSELRAVSGLLVPVHGVVGSHLDARTLVSGAKAFAALVLEGTLVQQVRIAERPALRLLGSGDMLWLGGESSTMLLAESHFSATPSTRVALLGDEVLIAARRFPRLFQGLLARVAEQTERDAAHLAINQLPRVEQRLIAIMRLLAEKWGYVTTAGTVVPLSLTHETLGGLIGASRPTVTLALGELSGRGELLKHVRGWLITERPPSAGGWSAELYGRPMPGRSNGSIPTVPSATPNGH